MSGSNKSDKISKNGDIDHVLEGNKELESDILSGNYAKDDSGNILKNKDRSSLVHDYFFEVGKEQLLSKEEEYNLMCKVKAGDRDAYKLMIKKNLRLVIQIALKYNNTQFGLMDRISEGNLGLIHAIEKFDLSKGFKFSTYAHWWIKQSIEKGMMDQGRSVRLPVHVVRLLSKYNRVSCRISKANKASLNEIANELKCDPDRLNKTLSGASTAIHLDASEFEGNASSLEVISDPSVANVEEFAVSQDSEFLILSALTKMLPYEHFIVVRHLGLIHNDRNTLQEISHLTGFSREQIRSRERKALEKFKPDLLGAIK